MGVGKSTVGRRLAQALGREFFDVDPLIEGRVGTTITALFSSGEEATFRRIEAEVIAELLVHRPAAVIALGGGALENPATLDAVLAGSLLVHLDQDFGQLRPALLTLRSGRPLLQARSEEEIEELYRHRALTYERAHLTVRLDRTGIDTATAAVLAALGVGEHGGLR
jgi:shikimate kinase